MKKQMTPRTRTLASLVTVALLVTVAALATTGATAAPNGNFYGVCGTVSAKGKTYRVRTVNVSCAVGRGIVSTLANKPNPGPNKRYSGKYSGMGCMYLFRGGASIFCTSLTPFRQVVGVLK